VARLGTDPSANKSTTVRCSFRSFLSADLDWHGAEAEYRRALVLAPNDGEAKLLLGYQLAVFGDLEPAIELTRQALATDPLRATSYRWLAAYLSGLSRLDEAERAIRRAIELQPRTALQYRRLAIIEIQRGNPQARLPPRSRSFPAFTTTSRWHSHGRSATTGGRLMQPSAR
jgi:tetratricopeptide (TPR) repeat protein